MFYRPQRLVDSAALATLIHHCVVAVICHDIQVDLVCEYHLELNHIVGNGESTLAIGSLLHLGTANIVLLVQAIRLQECASLAVIVGVEGVYAIGHADVVVVLGAALRQNKRCDRSFDLSPFIF